ncbi:TetR/AcrR family transcriptional regulator [Lysinibacter sp. HNR]|uniref:TetR/AcrR family transcriptional regulator n=1 Tax=Lysinibacter sp. HNR TaxID=3031408 RepID=UPI0024349537|nr:TetR/AcrR family transcriptional regulator [Lysinibacter sp. HNR]WGD37852.1 TetR/AcrR family transcriptional regulator [Lysinibacter sp. HNR]
MPTHTPPLSDRADGNARSRILDAYTSLLLKGNHRAATLDAVAKVAGVSKGGLLYHFPSKDALSQGLIEQLKVLAQEDISDICNAGSGAVEHFIRTSVNSDSPLDRSLIATVRLAQDSQEARDVLQQINETWYAVILDTVQDPQLARTIQIISDGIYFNTAINLDINKVQMSGDIEEIVDSVIAVVKRLTQPTA